MGNRGLPQNKCTPQHGVSEGWTLKIVSNLSVVKGRLKNLATKELFGASSVNYFTLWMENTADLKVSSSR